jgi:hypothetical protein
MGAEKVAAPCGHDDQTGNSQFCQLGIIAKKGSRPTAETRERQCHRAHELGRVNHPGEPFGLSAAQARTNPTPLRAQGLHRYSEQFRKSSENQSDVRFRLTHFSPVPAPPSIWRPQASRHQTFPADRKNICAKGPRPTNFQWSIAAGWTSWRQSFRHPTNQK